MSLSPPVGCQGRPPKLVLAAAGHMIAATTLLDILTAIGALLHTDSHDILHIVIHRNGLPTILGGPCVLTNKAHDSVEAQISKTPASRPGAILLHVSRVNRVAAKPPSLPDFWSCPKGAQELRCLLQVCLQRHVH